MSAALGTKGLERGYEGRARLEREGSRGTIRAFSPTSLFPLAVRVLTRQPRPQRKGKRQFAVVLFFFFTKSRLCQFVQLYNYTVAQRTSGGNSVHCHVFMFSTWSFHAVVVRQRIALFTVNFSHLHYNVFEHGCEAISGRNCKIARNCLTSTFKNIVM